MRRSLVLACLSLVFAATAAAEPDDEDKPSDTIKPVNIQVDPFGPLFGLFDGGGAYAVNPHVAVTGSLTYLSTGTNTYGWSFFQVAASVPLYLQRTFSGPYAEPGVIFRSFDHRSIDSGSNYGYHENWVGPQLLIGWQWSSDSGVNVALAAGVAQHWIGNRRYATGMEGSLANDPDFNGYFRVGYNF